MKLKKTKLNYFIVIIFTFITINFFGIYQASSDGLFLFLNSYDVALALLNIWFAYSYFSNNDFRKAILSSPLRYLLYIYIFILFIFITMPLRGPIGPIDAARVGRDYLILPLALLIFGYTKLENLNHRYFGLIKFIAVVTSLQIFVNAISPTLISSLFPAVNIREGFQLETQRNVLLSASMLFPHFLALIYTVKIIGEKISLYNAFYLFIFISASALQGFRSYFIALLIVIAVIILLNLNKQKTLKGLLVLPVILLGFIIIDSSIYNQQMTNKVVNTALEVGGEREGTLQVRYQRDQITIIPMLMEKPLIGWGFIYHSSTYGQQLGLMPSAIGDRRFSIYSIDSGYLTLLMQFGVMGVFYLLFLYTSMFYEFVRSDEFLNGVCSIVIGSFFILFIALSTHGGFFNNFGLLPFTLVLGLTYNNKV